MGAEKQQGREQPGAHRLHGEPDGREGREYTGRLRRGEQRFGVGRCLIHTARSGDNRPDLGLRIPKATDAYLAWSRKLLFRKN